MTTAGTAPGHLQTEPRTTWTGLKQAWHRIRHSEPCQVAAIVLVFVWYPLVSLHTSVVDPDIWWHMRTGEWILRHHHFPHTDPFSIHGAAKAWVAYSWGFEVLAYWIGKYWDLAGLAAFRLIMWLASTWALFHLMRKLARQFWPAAALTGLGSYLMFRVFGPRPGLFTVLFFLLELIVLLEADRSGRGGKLWLLPPLMCLWANIHAQFIYGLFVLGLFCAEPILNRMLHYEPEAGEGGKIPNRILWAVLASCTAATLVNPYGWRVYGVIADYGHQIWSTRFIVENSALQFDRPADYLLLLLMLAASYVLGRGERVRPLWVVLLIWAAIFTFRAHRDLWTLTIIACALLASRAGSARSESEPLERRVRLAALACVLGILTVAWQSFAPNSRQLLAEVAGKLPLGPVAYIHEHHLTGPMFNDFNWGGFLIYALPEERVAIDGRTNVHSPEELMRSFRTWAGDPDWTTDPLLARANLVIASPNFALTQLLRHDAHFKAIFEDRTAVLFQRVAPANGR